MKAANLQRYFLYRLDQLGRLGGVGAVLLILAAVLWGGWVMSEEREVLRQSRMLQSLRAQEADKKALPGQSSLGREEQLQIFYQTFPLPQDVPRLLRKIYAAAGAHELELETGEYARLQSGSERLVRYRVSLPIKGSFQQVFQFMDKVLRDNSTIALENVTFKRDKVDDAVVEAKLVFLLLVDSQP